MNTSINLNKQFEQLNDLFCLMKGLKCLNDLKRSYKRKRSCAVWKINRTRRLFGYYKVSHKQINNSVCNNK